MFDVADVLWNFLLVCINSLLLIYGSDIKAPRDILSYPNQKSTSGARMLNRHTRLAR